MSPWAISVVVGFGAGVWVYGRMMRLTGNNTQSAIFVGTLLGLVVMFGFRWGLSFIS